MSIAKTVSIINGGWQGRGSYFESAEWYGSVKAERHRECCQTREDQGLEPQDYSDCQHCAYYDERWYQRHPEQQPQDPRP